MLVNWIVVGVLIVMVLFFLRMKHMNHRAFIVVMILLLLFFYVSASKVISDNALNLKSFTGFITAGKMYFSWLIHMGGNVKQVTGDAAKLDWAGNLTAK